MPDVNAGIGGTVGGNANSLNSSLPTVQLYTSCYSPKIMFIVLVQK